jgi:hypothetical protein
MQQISFDKRKKDPSIYICVTNATVSLLTDIVEPIRPYVGPGHRLPNCHGPAIVQIFKTKSNADFYPMEGTKDKEIRTRVDDVTDKMAFDWHVTKLDKIIIEVEASHGKSYDTFIKCIQ